MFGNLGYAIVAKLRICDILGDFRGFLKNLLFYYD